MLVITALLLAIPALRCDESGGDPHAWSDREIRVLRSLSIDRLPPLPPDPSNAVADDVRAARLGRRLFFDERMSADGSVSCASCHRPSMRFTDGNPRSMAIGVTERNTPSVVGTAYNRWFYWDGRKDTQWSQALAPLEDPLEHGMTRTALLRVVATHHRTAYEEVFGPLPEILDRGRFPESAGPIGSPEERDAWAAMAAEDRAAVDRAFSDLGKALAAYQRTIVHGRSRFDDYVAAVVRGDAAAMREALTEEEARGLRLFVGGAQCTNCHFGPLFTNHEFHNTGLPTGPDAGPDEGRLAGVQSLLSDPFGCTSVFSDAGSADCVELRHVKSVGQELVGAFKTPGLRGVAETAPYMHDGAFETLTRVLEHYNEAPEPVVGHSDLVPLGLDDDELLQLKAFLGSLSGPVLAPPGWLEPPPGGQSSGEPTVPRQ